MTTDKATKAILAEHRSRHVRSSETATFDDLIGGDTLVSKGLAGQNSKGVFAENPAATPKHRTSNRVEESMARLLVPLPGEKERQKYLNSFGASSPARKLAEALAVTQETSGRDGIFGMGYIDFLLQTAQEAHQEKVQIVDTLSDNYAAYFFGENPPVFNYAGKLLNTKQDDWRNAFSVIYNNIIRGTQLARRNRLVTLTYDNTTVTGTIVSMTQTLTADMQMASDFSFQFLVKRMDIYRLPGATYNAPGKFPSNAVRPELFGNISLRKVRKTLRTVGTPQYVTSEPNKGIDEPPSGPSIQYVPLEEQQKQDTVWNYTSSEDQESLAALEYGQTIYSE